MQFYTIWNRSTSNILISICIRYSGTCELPMYASNNRGTSASCTTLQSTSYSSQIINEWPPHAVATALFRWLSVVLVTVMTVCVQQHWFCKNNIENVPVKSTVLSSLIYVMTWRKQKAVYNEPKEYPEKNLCRTRHFSFFPEVISKGNYRHQTKNFSTRESQ